MTGTRPWCIVTTKSLQPLLMGGCVMGRCSRVRQVVTEQYRGPMESLSELYEERAAIKQYDGNMSKQQAEQEAAKEIYGATRNSSV